MTETNEAQINPTIPILGGKTLRDEFAMAALPGVMASLLELAKAGKDVSKYSERDAAIAAYGMADAMLKARK